MAAVAAGAFTWWDFFVRVIGPQLAAAHFPTSTYWVAPRLVWEGRGALLYDPPAFAAAAVELGARPDLGFVPNAPPLVIALLPLGLLPEAVAYQLWTVLGLVALVGAVALLARGLRLPLPTTLLLFAALPLFHPVRANLVMGQAYAFVLLGMVATALAASRREWSARFGLALAAVAWLKLYYGLVMFVAALVGRRWKAVTLFAAVLAVAAVIGGLLVGPGGWLFWLATVLGWRSRPETAVTAYQTLTSLFGHLFRYDPTWNPAPVGHLPLAADVLWLAAGITIAAVSLGVIVRAGREPSVAVLAMAMLVPAAIILSPIAEDYHYVLALFALVVAATAAVRSAQFETPVVLALVGAGVLLAPAWPFNQPRVDGVAALLFYPRVYGAVLLWAVLARLLWRGTSLAPRSQ